MFVSFKEQNLIQSQNYIKQNHQKMKRNHLLFQILLFSIISFFSQSNNKIVAQNQQNTKQNIQQNAWSDKTRILPDTLRRVPVGITLYHSPNPNYPEINDTKTDIKTTNNGKYVWKHSTFVRAETEDLEVVAAGSFIWFSEKGWFTNVQYDKKEFSEKFACKNGVLKKGEVYCFKNNFRFGDNLYGGDALWFVLAKDKNGKIYKGMGLIETEDQLINTKDVAKNTNQKSYEVNNDLSKINWTGYGEIGDYSLTGTIKLKTGNFQFDGKKARANSFNDIFTGLFVFDMTTISHTEKSLENHLKNEDFFEVSKFPTATFELVSVQKGNAFGFLTIKNIKKNISFPINITEKNDPKDSQKGNQITINGIIPVDRTLFGITYNSKNFFKDLGDNAIKNIFDLKFEIVAEKVK